MSSKTAVLTMIDKYNALTVPDQTILQALSALYEPAAAPVVASCLAGAGCRESPLRAFSPQIVATRLSRLAKAGFVQEQSVESRAQKILLWRCRADVGEVAIRHAVRDGRFLPIAKAALAETHGRDWKGEGADDSQQRRLHLAFHAGDWRLAAQAVGYLSQNDIGSGGLFLANLLRIQPDDSWRRTASPAAFGPVLASAVRDAASGLADPGPMLPLAAEILEKEAKNPAETGDLPFALVESLTLRGKLKDAYKIANLAAPDNSALATLPPALAEGRADAPELAENAMARRRSHQGGILPQDSGAVWIALAVMTGDLADAVEGMIRRMTAASMQNHPDAGALSALRHAFLFMAGQASAARLLPDNPADRKSLTLLCHALALLRIDPTRLEKLRPDLSEASALAGKSGYQWLGLQLEALAAATEGKTLQEGRWPLLTRFFKEEDAWRRGLKALEDLSREPGEETAQAGKRLAWLINFPAHPEDVFMPFEIQPIEQSLAKDGQWSKGRNVALRRIFQHAPDFDYISDADRMVFATLRYDFDGVSQGFHFDTGTALAHLIGHPLVFRGDDSGARLDIEPGRFELSVTDQNGGCEITLEPALTDFVPEGHSGEELLDAAKGDGLAGTLARLETPTRLRVYPLRDRERQLARVIGDGLTIPARGRDEALHTLGKLSGIIHLHSDLPELAGEGETVAADNRPRFHITPQTVGVRVEVWAHPLGDAGPAYRPGRGGRMLTANVDGRLLKTRRDAHAEKAAAAEVVAACPALSGREDGDLSWRLEDPEAALGFLAETEDLKDRAVFLWPKGGRYRVRRLRGFGGLRLRVKSSADWFELEGGLEVDENLVVDIGRLLASMRHSGGKFVEIGEGEYLALTNELRRQLGDLESLGEFHNGRFRLSDLAGSAVEALEEAGARIEADAEWRRQLALRRDLAAFQPELPGAFNGDLREYQLEGYRWMARLAEWGAGACLADDMGLGKTVQTLALLVRRGSLGPALVVAPTSVCHNWMAETARFAPILRMSTFREGNRGEQVKQLGAGDVLILSYSLLRQEDEALSGVKWATVVLDEAQAIKNVSAKRSKAAMSLEAGFRLITTGTPIENHLGELWNLFRFINPHLLGSWRKFQERFAAPIEREHDGEASERLRRIIRPFILRRTKLQVLDSLPPKTEITLSVELAPKERAFYESLRRSALERLEAEPAAAEKKRFQILAEIMRLRRACCAPQLVTGGEGISSAKQEQFKTTLGELVENKHKVLVFSQFVDHLSIIRAHLEREGYRYQYLDGSTPTRQRKKAVEDFQAGIGDVFLISLKAGGLGLNLTAADYVIHMDPWWNPAVEDQASDRAHRIGQDKPVTVYRLVAAGTIEEKIVQLHRNKRDLADNLLSGADQSAALDMEEIMRLLRDDA